MAVGISAEFGGSNSTLAYLPSCGQWALPVGLSSVYQCCGLFCDGKHRWAHVFRTHYAETFFLNQILQNNNLNLNHRFLAMEKNKGHAELHSVN